MRSTQDNEAWLKKVLFSYWVRSAKRRKKSDGLTSQKGKPGKTRDGKSVWCKKKSHFLRFVEKCFMFGTIGEFQVFKVEGGTEVVIEGMDEEGGSWRS